MPGASPPPSISIVLATYNGEAFLRPQLESLARQSVPPLELIVGDDGSSDATLDMLGQFARGAPFPVTVIRNTARLGCHANFIALTEHCRGELIAFCDQDDVWDADKLRVMQSLFDGPQVLLAFHNDRLIDANGNILGLTDPSTRDCRIDPLCIDLWTPVHGHSQVMRRALVRWNPLHPRTLDPWIPGQPMTHDQFYIFWASIFGTIAYSGRPLVDYRQHGSNFSGFNARNGLTRAWRDITMAGHFLAGEAAATAQRLAMLKELDAPLSPGETTQLGRAQNYYAGLLPHILRRSRLYDGSGAGERLAALVQNLRDGAYGRTPSWRFGLGGFLQDLVFGLPFGPCLKDLSRRIDRQRAGLS